jgi:hypothetical protein
MLSRMIRVISSLPLQVAVAQPALLNVLDRRVVGEKRRLVALLVLQVDRPHFSLGVSFFHGALGDPTLPDLFRAVQFVIHLHQVFLLEAPLRFQD